MVYEKLCELLASQFGVDESTITMDTNIVDDLGADSLDVVELISCMEDEFNLIITDERGGRLHRGDDLKKQGWEAGFAGLPFFEHWDRRKKR